MACRAVPRQESDYPGRLDEVYAAARDQTGDHVRPVNGPMPDLWTDWELRCLYELDSPDIENRSTTCDDGTEILWLLAADGSWARGEGASGTVHQSGPRRLWDELEHVQSKWEQAGRFPLHEMTVELGPDRSVLVSPDRGWILGL
ncbi:hypothetical protein [Kribbella sp. NPDC051718]|uniref:hypothetical protein n=1 Tax=Kribbella sp. NPDC051718 TaxID=3155168 RepID=UPI00343228E3